jgi:hypothetical protein
MSSIIVKMCVYLSHEVEGAPQVYVRGHAPISWDWDGLLLLRVCVHVNVDLGKRTLLAASDP